MLRLLYAGVGVSVAVADQASKAWAVARLSHTPPQEILPGLFRLVLVRNRGALFGMFQGLQPELRQVVFTALPAVVIAVLGWFAWRAAARDHRAQWAFALLMGGALGNLADRVRLGHVVDFLDFYIAGPGGALHHWPAFNLADASICVGIGLLALDSLRSGRIPSREENRAPDPV